MPPALAYFHIPIDEYLMVDAVANADSRCSLNFYSCPYYYFSSLSLSLSCFTFPVLYFPSSVFAEVLAQAEKMKPSAALL